MKYPKCQFENPEGIKFCGECGAKVERLCPICNSSSPPNFKFCGACGHKFEIPVETFIKALSFDEKLDKIQRYLPKGLAEKILARKNKIEGEHKQVTVMFCDMEDYSQLYERLGIQEAVEPNKSDLSAVPTIYPLTALAGVYHLKGQTDKAIPI